MTHYHVNSRLRAVNNLSSNHIPIIHCSGSKNLAMKALIACLLTDQPTILHNIPDITAIHTTIALLETLNVSVQQLSSHSYKINPINLISTSTLPKANRTIISLFGILAHKFNTATLPLMDGCTLGSRSTDIHDQIYKLFGIQIDNQTMIKTHQLASQTFSLPYPSVGATETFLFLAILATGTSYISNIAIEPEIIALISMLQSMGAIIEWMSDRTLKITGVTNLRGTEYTIMPDRLEPITWAILAYSYGPITVANLNPTHIQSILSAYTQLGGQYTLHANNTTITFHSSNIHPFSSHPFSSHPFSLTANVYPAIATDQLPQFAAFLTPFAKILHDTLYETRMHDVHQMLKLFGIPSDLTDDCNDPNCRFYKKHHHYLHIQPIQSLNPIVNIMYLPKNIRCANAYILLALQSNKPIQLIDQTNSLKRGYEHLIHKLNTLNFQITEYS